MFVSVDGSLVCKTLIGCVGASCNNPYDEGDNDYFYECEVLASYCAYFVHVYVWAFVGDLH